MIGGEERETRKERFFHWLICFRKMALSVLSETRSLVCHPALPHGLWKPKTLRCLPLCSHYILVEKVLEVEQANPLLAKLASHMLTVHVMAAPLPPVYDLQKLWRMDQVSGPCTHVGDMEEAPGF